MYNENDCNHGPDESDCGGYEHETGRSWQGKLKDLVLLLSVAVVLGGIFLWPSYRREARAEPYLIEASARIKQALYWKTVGEFSSAQNELKKAADNLKFAQEAFGKNKRSGKIESVSADFDRAGKLTQAEAKEIWEKIKNKKGKFLELPQ